MKLKRILSIGLCLALLAALMTVPAFAADTEKTLTLRENWRLTSDLDLNIPEGTTLTIDGSGSHIYEMGGRLLNSGLGTVTFAEGTILYPAANDTDATHVTISDKWDTAESNALMQVRQPHTVRVDSSIANGSVTASAAQAKMGDTVTLTVNADTGYVLDTLTVTDASNAAVAVANNTFTMPASGVTVTATFKVGSSEPTTYTVSVQNDGNGSASASPASAAQGTEITLTATANSGYHFKEWQVDSDAVTVSGNSFTMPAENVIVKAIFEKDSGSGSTGGSSSSGGSSSGTTTETTTNSDGSTTTTVTNKTTGTVTETTKFTDGSSLVVVTEKDGTVTTTETTVDKVVVKTVDEPGEDMTATVTIPRSVGTTTVSIPADTTPGTVAVDAGTGEIVKLSVPTEDGMLVKLDGSASLVLVDMSKDFTDTDSHWAEDAIDFATAHGMFSGTSATTFSPDRTMTRGMIAVVLHNFEDNPDHAFEGSFDDVHPDSWYADGIHWMVDNGIASGYGNGQFGAEDNITREQLATFLYRYAGAMGYGTSGGSSLSGFTDADSVSSYATEAMQWAVGNGLFGGMGDGTLAPRGSATRAQVATILTRFVENLTK